ncbi:DUF934 domain-containing protein [Niveibacterium sp. SC-1]|uniref:DUF934 domain-containing protein n=1 Tax=Niveibacterium sp. SC-1 TaxID=3135646 RepID=UPI00311D61CF
MSNFVKGTTLSANEWNLLRYPVVAEAEQKQAGKTVIFKVTGTEAASAETIAAFALPAGKIIVPLKVWLARREELTPRLAAGELGVWFESFELIEDLIASVEDINVFPVIAWDFVRFADGRGFSSAALLRQRYGYRNELRAIGDVLRDQLFFMRRCGFDAYELRADRSAQDALEGFKDFAEPYQAAVHVDQPVWRRHAR